MMGYRKNKDGGGVAKGEVAKVPETTVSDTAGIIYLLSLSHKSNPCPKPLLCGRSGILSCGDLNALFLSLGNGSAD